MTPQSNPDVAEQVKLAAEAFFYGYPLVYNLHEIAKFPAGPNLAQPEPLPYNTFGYARKLLDPNAHFVSPNNDTLYRVAMCDVRTGPLVLHVPDTHDRYYVLQLSMPGPTTSPTSGGALRGRRRGAISWFPAITRAKFPQA